MCRCSVMADLQQLPAQPRASAPWRRDRRDELRAAGHQHVRSVLTSQPAPTTAWHALPGGIDHLVVSPGGVFVVMDVCVPNQWAMVLGDSVVIGGLESDLIKRADRHADWVAGRMAQAAGLSLTVRSLIVFTHYRRLAVRQSPSRACVLSTTGLAEWLHRRAPVLSALQMAEVTSAAWRAETWGVDEWPRSQPMPNQRAGWYQRLTTRQAD